MTQPSRAEETLRDLARTALQNAGISQAEAARRLGLSHKHVNQMLTGKAPITLGWAERVLALCGRRLKVTAPRNRARNVPKPSGRGGRPPTVHAQPPTCLGPTLCCGRELIDLAYDDQVTADPDKVTCRAIEQPPCRATIRSEHYGLVTCVFRVGHWDQYGPDHGGPKTKDGRLRWSDTADGATPHQLADTPGGQR